jgi:hypothetical protein
VEEISGNSKHSAIFHYATIIMGAFLLLIPAFYNGFPLVISDTANYISSGFMPETPWDRPITYGILMRIFSLNGFSLWLVVFMQAYIVSWLITTIIKHFSGNNFYTIACIAILSCFSSLPWICSQLIADVYTPIALLCMALLLLEQAKKFTKILLYSLYFIAVATHLSHLMLFILLLGILFITRKYFFNNAELKQVRQKILVLFLLTISTLAITANAISKSQHVFFMASMNEKGILKKYLDEHCSENDYKLCKYRDALPAGANAFLWNENSPFYKEGGNKATKDEYNKIIHATLCSRVYIPMYISTSLRFSAMQLIKFNIGDENAPYPEKSNVADKIAEYMPHHSHQYLNALQNKNELLSHLVIPNNIFTAFVLLSLLCLCAIIIKRKFFTKRIYLLIFLSITGIIINAWDCATFSSATDRYGCRMIWLIPFCVIVALINLRRAPTPSSALP